MKNEVKQVGGSHYAKAGSTCPNCAAPIQHWDYAAGLPYLDGQISKYIDRHQEKNGFQDMLKALTYWEKAARHYYPTEYQAWLSEHRILSVTQGMLHEWEPDFSEGEPLRDSKVCGVCGRQDNLYHVPQPDAPEPEEPVAESQVGAPLEPGGEPAETPVQPG